jgi:hypothetical protein
MGEKSLIFIEIQTGSTFDANDIVRYEDDYGRRLVLRKSSKLCFISG